MKLKAIGLGTLLATIISCFSSTHKFIGEKRLENAVVTAYETKKGIVIKVKEPRPHIAFTHLIMPDAVEKEYQFNKKGNLEKLTVSYRLGEGFGYDKDKIPKEEIKLANKYWNEIFGSF